MENDRLSQLKRQKQVLLEHLDWINQEIDRENLQTARSPSPSASRLAEAIAPDRPVAKSLEPESFSQPQVAADLYDELGPDTRSAAAATKRGCLLFGTLAFAALAGLIGYAFFWYK